MINKRLMPSSAPGSSYFLLEERELIFQVTGGKHAGVVAMISQEDVEAFYVFHIDTTTGKVLASN
jgi:hypothetical protein